MRGALLLSSPDIAHCAVRGPCARWDQKEEPSISHISPELIERFNHAAGLARQGRYEESLEAWQRLLDPPDEKRDEPRMVTGDFLGQSMMRKAWVLMDLHRYEEARQTFEDDVLQACLGQFSLSVLYEYFFSYGNTLGSLGDVAGMDDALTRAMGIAAEELGEYPRVAQCWRNLFEHATRAAAWSYLAKECPSCVTLAERCGDDALAELARATHQRALQELG